MLVVKVRQDLIELCFHLANLAVVILILLLVLTVRLELFSFITLIASIFLSVVCHLVILTVAVIS